MVTYNIITQFLPETKHCLLLAMTPYHETCSKYVKVQVAIKDDMETISFDGSVDSESGK